MVRGGFSEIPPPGVRTSPRFMSGSRGVPRGATRVPDTFAGIAGWPAGWDDPGEEAPVSPRGAAEPPHQPAGSTPPPVFCSPLRTHAEEAFVRESDGVGVLPTPWKPSHGLPQSHSDGTQRPNLARWPVGPGTGPVSPGPSPSAALRPGPAGPRVVRSSKQLHLPAFAVSVPGGMLFPCTISWLPSLHSGVSQTSPPQRSPP